MPRSTLSSRLAALIGALAILTALVPIAAAADPATPGRGFSYTTAEKRAVVNVREAASQPDVAGPARVDKPLLRPARLADQAPLAPTPLVPEPATSSGAPAPSIEESFPGLADIDNDPYQPCSATACLEPSDPWVAVGPNHVFQAVNTMFRISDRTGTTLETITFADFFGLNPAFNSVADPRVIYDQRRDRWVAIDLSYECGGTSATNAGFIDFAVSHTGDPTGAWTSYFLQFDEVLPDYPGIGTSADKVVLSSNNFDIDDFCNGSPTVDYTGAQLFVMDWATLAAHPAGEDLPIAATSEAPTIFTYRPALSTPARSGQNTIHVVAERDDLAIIYRAITGTVAADNLSISASTTISGLSALEIPPQPRQDGTPGEISNAVDERLTDAVWQNNRLVTVTTHLCDLGGGGDADCVRVIELSTSTTTPTLTQDFLVGEDGVDYFMGGVGLSGGGDLHVVYSKSSPTTFVTTESVYQRASDDPATVSDPAELSASTETYEGTRWGDYVGVAQDPVDSSAVWQGNQVADNSSWVTEITQMRTDGAEFVAIDPVRVLDTRFNIGLNGKFNHAGPRAVQVAGVLGIPDDAAAITGNLTVIQQSRAGFVSVTPQRTTSPSTSTINFPAGDTRANNLTIPLSPTGLAWLVYIASTGHNTHLALDVTGYFVYDDNEATYIPIEPERVLDSRFGVGVIAEPFQDGVARNWQVEQACSDVGVTDDVVAVTGNVTVIGQTERGFVSVTPTDDNDPATSTLNFPVGDTRANGIAVQTDSADGSLSATYVASEGTGETAHIAFDLTGCFVDATSGASWFPIDPTRRLDTRTNVGLSQDLLHNTARTLSLAGAQFVEATATGITGNLTVVGPQRTGFLSLTTVTTVPPETSTLNFPKGDTRANGVFGQLTGGGDVVLIYFANGGTATTKTDGLLDVTGYFR